MPFEKPSPNSSTSWRTRRYRESLNAKEEDKLWQIIEEFIDTDVMKPRSQLRFFKAIEKFTKAVHIERLRWKRMKELKITPQIEIVIQQAFKKYNVTIDELIKGTRRKTTRPEIYKARKYVAHTLVHELGLSRQRSARMIGTSTSNFSKWLEENVSID